MTNPRDLLGRIPLFAGADREAIPMERLGGLTNLVYRVGLDGRDYLLRIAGKGTEEYIDRANEHRDARAAARAGVSAEVLFFDESDGLMLASWIDGETLNAALGELGHGSWVTKRGALGKSEGRHLFVDGWRRLGSNNTHN